VHPIVDLLYGNAFATEPWQSTYVNYLRKDAIGGVLSAKTGDVLKKAFWPNAAASPCAVVKAKYFQLLDTATLVIWICECAKWLD